MEVENETGWLVPSNQPADQGTLSEWSSAEDEKAYGKL